MGILEFAAGFGLAAAAAAAAASAAVNVGPSVVGVILGGLEGGLEKVQGPMRELADASCYRAEDPRARRSWGWGSEKVPYAEWKEKREEKKRKERKKRKDEYEKLTEGEKEAVFWERLVKVQERMEDLVDATCYQAEDPRTPRSLGWGTEKVPYAEWKKKREEERRKERNDEYEKWTKQELDCIIWERLYKVEEHLTEIADATLYQAEDPKTTRLWPWGTEKVPYAQWKKKKEEERRREEEEKKRKEEEEKN